jgi:Ca2+-binding EF-hand superfamily protein
LCSAVLKFVFAEDGVSLEELTEMFKKFGMNLSEDDMKNIFKVLDVDGDGSVSKDELVHWKLSHTTSVRETDFKSMAKEIFDLFDEDGSGEITVEEFVDTLKKFDAGNIFFPFFPLSRSSRACFNRSYGD